MRRPSERHRLFAALYGLQRVWEPLGYARHRRAVAWGVRGRALEIGVGSGFSLPYYRTPPAAAVDINVAMLRRARARTARLGVKLPLVVADARALPFAEGAFDTVVSQSVMCSVEDPRAVARDVRRVLAPGGAWRFVEHGRSARGWYARIQRSIAPVWRALCAGCRLDGDPIGPMRDAGLIEEKLRRCNGGAVARGTFRRPDGP